MIAKLTGRIDSVSAEGVVLDVGGVGYLVFCSERTVTAVAGASAIVSLHIETHVREDHIHLYGFIEAAERNAFRLLTTVQGVGARLALAILSVLPPDALSHAIAASDRAALARAAGVGPKLATRIVSELKDKVAVLATGAPGGVDIAVAPLAPPAEAGSDGATADAVSALVNLGYGRSEAFAAVARVARARGTDAPVETLIREGLHQLAGGEARA